MKRSLIVLFAAAVILLEYGCAPQAPPAPPPPPMAAQLLTNCFSASNVVDLANNFNVRRYAECQLQTCSNPPAAPVAGSMSTYAQTIANAINSMASPELRTDLCTLDKIYIDGTGRNAASAWGMRDKTGVRFIGLSKATLDPLTTQVPTTALGSYETSVVQQLLIPRDDSGLPDTSTLSDDAWNFIHGVSYVASPDSPSLAMLAMLAHEMGHIMYVANEPLLETKCASYNSKPFFKPSWRKKAVHFGFHQFGDPDRTNPPKSAVNVDTLQAELENAVNDTTMVGQAENDLLSVFASGSDPGPGEWASFFATVSVDEDFVETYKLMGLTTPPSAGASAALSSLSITIPTGSAPIEIVGSLLNNSNSALYVKKQWITQCFAPNAH